MPGFASPLLFVPEPQPPTMRRTLTTLTAAADHAEAGVLQRVERLLDERVFEEEARGVAVSRAAVSGQCSVWSARSCGAAVSGQWSVVIGHCGQCGQCGQWSLVIVVSGQRGHVVPRSMVSIVIGHCGHCGQWCRGQWSLVIGHCGQCLRSAWSCGAAVCGQ